MPRPKMTAEHVTDLLSELVYSNVFKFVPLEKVTELLKKHNLLSERNRKLPAESIIYLQILMALNADISISSVLGKMLYPIRLMLGINEDTKNPVKSAIVKARKRLSVNFFEDLFKSICRPQADKNIAGCFFKNYRLVAVDGTAQSIQNTPENANEFGYSINQNGEALNPKVRITALMECGTKSFFALKYSPYKVSEVAQFKELIPSLSSDMLLLADRDFYGVDIWHQCLKHCGALVWRMRSKINLPVKKRLSDGSYISEIKPRNEVIKDNPELKNKTIMVRVVEFQTVFEDGSKGEVIKLMTSILDENEASAEEIAKIYPERWLIEDGFSELKTYMDKNKVLRSQLPSLVKQEIYSFFLAHFVVRSLMTESARRNNISPNELSFYATLSIIKERVVFFPSNKKQKKTNRSV